MESTFAATVVGPIGPSVAPFTQGQFLACFHVVPEGFDEEELPRPGFRFMSPDIAALDVLSEGARVELTLLPDNGEFVLSTPGSDATFRALIAGVTQVAALRHKVALTQWLKARPPLAPSREN